MSSTTAADPGRPLDGRTAIVTGASRGIGREIARVLHDAGATLVLLGRDPTALREATETLRGRTTIVDIDLARDDAVDRVVPRIREQLGGAPDIIVNNAAHFALAPVHETAVAAFERTLRVNVVAPFALVRAFLPEMTRRRGGHIVSIGSIADHVGMPGNAAYAASKFGLRGLHEVLRAELQGTGVRATLISPAHVDTTVWDTAPSAADVPARVDMLSPRAVADAVRYAVTRAGDVNVDELRLSRA